MHHVIGLKLTRGIKNGVYLGVKTCEVFLCFVAIVRVRVYYGDLLICFLCFTLLVSVTYRLT